MPDLIVAEVIIPEDSHGRFNLNILHRASGTGEAKSPSDWLRRKTTKALISELESQRVNLPFDVVKGGDAAGTYAHQLLAISYAGWISPAFQLKVNQAFLDMKSAQLVPVSQLPVMHDPALKMLVDMAHKLDESRYEMTCIKDEQTRQSHEIIAAQARIIETYEASQRAETKADMALDEAHRMTIEEFVLVNGLIRQFPHTKHREYARWLGNFCLQYTLKTPKAPVLGKSWDKEKSYPLQALAAWLRYEQRRPQQITLVRPPDEGSRHA